VLVNCAGIIQEKPFLETTEADWRRMIDTDLGSVFHTCRAVLPGMVARGRGVVINIASDLGILGRAEYAPYCAAKAGVIGLTKSLAREFAPQHIRVNAIAPGPVWTPLNPSDKEAEDVSKFGSDTPMKRPAQPEEIAPAYVFLASPQCSSYITGEILPIVGGY
jgi:3-oxoacyl-[acyl-carrier protein] reductase